MLSSAREGNSSGSNARRESTAVKRRKNSRRRRRAPAAIAFTKMHGLGNDFVVLDRVTQHFQLDEKLIRALADRRFGVGCDQVLVVETPGQPDVDFRYRIFNADGSEVEQCGNGARCFARFVKDRQLIGKDTIRVETCSGIIELTVIDRTQVRVDMGLPNLQPADIPLLEDCRKASYMLDIDGDMLEMGAVSMGNPHAVISVDDVDEAPVEVLGRTIQQSPVFPNSVNVGFMQILSRTHIRLRVYERGVGETLACGTGACAAVVSGVEQGLLDNEVVVDLPGGQLNIQWDGEGQPVIMIGPAISVFEGQYRP
ncbi:MAG: diaminopimelate epimerase [Pseudomonadales bacterium]